MTKNTFQEVIIHAASENPGDKSRLWKNKFEYEKNQMLLTLMNFKRRFYVNKKKIEFEQQKCELR